MKKKKRKTKHYGLQFTDEQTQSQHRGVRLLKPKKRKKRTTVRKKRSKPTMKAATKK